MKWEQKWAVINHTDELQTNEKKTLLRVWKVETTLPFFHRSFKEIFEKEKGTFGLPHGYSIVFISILKKTNPYVMCRVNEKLCVGNAMWFWGQAQ